MSNTNGSKWIRPEKRHAIYERDGYKCCYCGRHAEAADAHAVLTLDHVTPRELGGGHEAGNLVTACLTCNSARRDLPMARWIRHLASNGADVTGMAGRVRRQTSRPVTRTMVAAARERLAALKN